MKNNIGESHLSFSLANDSHDELKDITVSASASDGQLVFHADIGSLAANSLKMFAYQLHTDMDGITQSVLSATTANGVNVNLHVICGMVYAGQLEHAPHYGTRQSHRNDTCGGICIAYVCLLTLIVVLGLGLMLWYPTSNPTMIQFPFARGMSVKPSAGSNLNSGFMLQRSRNVVSPHYV
jgi:hypothetical protein